MLSALDPWPTPDEIFETGNRQMMELDNWNSVWVTSISIVSEENRDRNQ